MRVLSPRLAAAFDRLGVQRPVEQGESEYGTCGFCGAGDGWLGSTGDEMSQILHGAVRTGEAPDWKYEMHPNAHANGTVTWCGSCVRGLAHKYQRYDDANLHALKVSMKVRLELDGLRWSGWEEPLAEHPRDDPAVHMEKLSIVRDVRDAENEEFRRDGFDLTTRGWHP